MNKIPRLLSLHISRFCSDKWILNRTIPFFLPFYHAVSNEKLPYLLNYPYRDVKQFEIELDYFLTHFHPAGLEEIVSEDCTGKKLFHLSFDDGLRQCADVIAPVLLRKGIPATFFINTAFADNKNLFHRYKASLILSRLMEKPALEVERFLTAKELAGERILAASISQVNVLNEAAGMLDINFDDFLKNQKPYLTSTQIKKLATEGFSIGAHSHFHPEFWEISEKEQLNEVKTSIEWVNQLIKPAIKAFSFPFTDDKVPASVLTSLKKEKTCDITFGTAGIKKDSFSNHFQRYPVEQPGDFSRNLKAEIVYYELRKWAGKATVTH